MMDSAGAKFRRAIEENVPLQIVGAVNAYCSILAEQVGFKALYLSGAGVANASYGLPDLGMTSLKDVLVDVRRTLAVSDLPLLVDIDTGWEESVGIARTIEEMEKTGVAAVQIEDQVARKRCGHRPNKRLVNTSEMIERIKESVDARKDESFFVLARTDAYSVEGLENAINRAKDYVLAGADGVFAEGVSSLEDYRAFAEALDVPVLANITEFGETPLFTKEELASVGIRIALYPLSAFRAMSKSALLVYQSILDCGSQAEVIDSMQTRQELYESLNYFDFEKKMDTLLGDEQ